MVVSVLSAWSFSSSPMVHADGSTMIVGTSTSNPAISYPYERNLFYASGRIWVFYFDGSSFVYSTSTDDGSTWASPIMIASQLGNQLAVTYNGTDVYYARSGGGSIYYRQGVPLGTGFISWLSPEATVCLGDSVSGNYCIAPSIATDSSGHAWVIFNYYTSGYNMYVYADRNGRIDGTWSSVSTYILSTYTSSILLFYYPSIIALSNNVMVAVWHGGNGALIIESWNGSSWSAPISSSNTLGGSDYGAMAAITGAGGIAHIIYETSASNIVDLQYFYAYLTKTETTVQSSVTPTSAPSVSIDPSNGNVYVFWSSSPTNNHVYYKKYVNSTTIWDSNPTDWLTEPLSSNSLINVSAQVGGSCIIGLVDQTGSSTPFNVRFSCLSLSFPPTSTGLTVTTTSTSLVTQTNTQTTTSSSTTQVTLTNSLSSSTTTSVTPTTVISVSLSTTTVQTTVTVFVTITQTTTTDVSTVTTITVPIALVPIWFWINGEMIQPANDSAPTVTATRTSIVTHTNSLTSTKYVYPNGSAAPTPTTTTAMPLSTSGSGNYSTLISIIVVIATILIAATLILKRREDRRFATENNALHGVTLHGKH